MDSHHAIQIGLVELASDDVVLTTIGNYLDYVPDQEWLEKIPPNLIARHMQEDILKQVTIIDDTKMINECNNITKEL
ncbi:hypothetical protein QJ527_00200 [Enterococcus mundtii]|uniref:hypothetical protein n=1 Tax=Enterococcus TaxID=1350 RepID=UPI0004515476|nr:MULTISPECIES: hypothetical protein [Enterococcus]EYT97061.1 hypothetical protein AK89_01475 [Enterococcus mundtii CRL35]MDK4209969.1 hypothetical protein [Enterococcus mundtii]MDO7878458.1 hypothetical protein [Enterococcus mundtii]